jgi:Flp pilus assembly protein TadG
VKRRIRTENDDEGSVMPMVTIFVVFLMLAAWALVSSSQQWNARREAHATAAAAARAGAQGDPNALRSGLVLDPDSARSRAQRILDSAGYRGTISIVDASVTVNVTVAVQYAFPTPGFAHAVSGSSTATARRSVDGQDGG